MIPDTLKRKASDTFPVKIMVRVNKQHLNGNGANIRESTEMPSFNDSALCSISERGGSSEFQESQEHIGLLPRNKSKSTGDPQLLENPRETENFLEQVFNESASFMSCSGTASFTTTPPSSFPSRTDGALGSTSFTKRRRLSNEEEWDEPKRPRKQKRPKPDDRTDKGLRQRRLACHFHLFDQQKYCKNNLTGKKYETCSGPGSMTMHYLKSVKRCFESYVLFLRLLTFPGNTSVIPQVQFTERSDVRAVSILSKLPPPY